MILPAVIFLAFLPTAAVEATTIGQVEQLGALFPANPADVDPVAFARSAARVESAPAALLDALATGSIPDSRGDRIVVEGAVERAIEQAVEELGWRPFAAFAAVALDPDAAAPSPAHLGALQTVVSLVGTHDQLSPLLALTHRLDPECAGGSAATHRLEGGIVSIVDRDERALARLADLFARMPEAQRLACIRAVGNATARNRREWLVHRIGRGSALDLSILAELARPDHTFPPLDDRELADVRAFLHADDPQHQREAVRAVVSLGDMEAVSALIDNLEASDPVVRGVAHAALVELTGLRLGKEPQRWATWVSRERRWYDGEAPTLLRRLGNPNSEIVAATLDALSSHRRYRDELAVEIEPLLWDDAPEVRRRACVALRRLGSRAVLGGLANALGDDDERVASEAYASLCTLTERQLAPVRERWLALVEG